MKFRKSTHMVAAMTLAIWTGFALGDEGADVIVGVLDGTTDYNRNDEIAVLAVGTTSCNAGTEVLNWFALPNNQHPVIGQNFYRLMDGRMIQLGQAWLKHGFTALQGNACGLGCTPNGSGTGLGIGCSDPYGAGLNSGPGLGARSEINPVTGFYEGGAANNHAGHNHTSISHGLQVSHSELALPGARYFIEGHYIAPDDATGGNGNNNASYREVSMSGSPTNWNFSNIGPTVQTIPAIMAWEGAEFAIHDTWPEDGRIIVAYKVTPLKGSMHRYDYAVYNMNSDRSIRMFSLPIGDATVSNVGFHAVLSHDEPYSNTPWTHTVADGQITWQTELFQDDPNANAIRWGTTYNFWFDADVAPISSSSTLGRFKPGPGGATLFAMVDAPAPGDCNNNGIPDDEDTISGSSVDCNENFFPDECELAGNDCNEDNILDLCQTLDDCDGNGIIDDCEPAFIRIVSSDPPNGSIDARIPHQLNDASDNFNSWRSLRVTFDGPVEDLLPEDFTIAVSGGAGPLAISSMTFVEDDVVRITLNGFIPLGSWTTLTHTCTDTSTRLGYLPGDVNGDGVTAPLDILAIVDALNGITALPEWSTDINRSDLTEPTDILAVIDLLNGAGEFDVWNGAALDNE